MNFQLSWYVIMTITGLMAGAFFCNYWNNRQAHRVSGKLLIETGLMYLLILLIGSKVFFIVQEVILGRPITVSLFQYHGKWSGALISGSLYLLLIKTIRAKSKLAESLLLGTLVGLIFGKLGCFFSGHYGCHGIPTQLPWGVTYVFGINSIVSVHPVQLYDALFHTILLVCLMKFLKSRDLHKGIFFLLFTSSYTILIGFLRVDEQIFFGVSLSQILYTIIIVMCLIVGYKGYFSLLSKHN